MTPTTANANDIFAMSDYAFNKLIAHTVKPGYISFDSSGVATNGTPFNPGVPCFFSKNGL